MDLKEALFLSSRPVLEFVQADDDDCMSLTMSGVRPTVAQAPSCAGTCSSTLPAPTSTTSSEPSEHPTNACLSPGAKQSELGRPDGIGIERRHV